MSSSVCVGIDPGVHGAIAVLSGAGELIGLHDMPIFVVRRGGKNTSHVNVHELGNILRPHAGETAVIENVGPMPSDSRMSAFRFGAATGALHGACGVLRMRIENPRPQEWKKHFGLTADKGQARQLATRRFPAHADMFKRVKDDGRAEAALIALWAIRGASA